MLISSSSPDSDSSSEAPRTDSCTFLRAEFLVSSLNWSKMHWKKFYCRQVFVKRSYYYASYASIVWNAINSSSNMSLVMSKAAFLWYSQSVR